MAGVRVQDDIPLADDDPQGLLKVFLLGLISFNIEWFFSYNQ